MREEAQNPDADAAEESPRPGKLVPLLVLVVCLLVGSGAGALVLGPKLFAAPSAEAGQAAEDDEKQGGHGGEAVVALVLLENLVVNPANSGGTRFLLISFAFEPGDADPAVLQAAEPQLRDTFVTLLSKRTIAELGDLAMRDSIRAELLAATNRIVPGVARLYLPQFVMQ
jgi:flagellar protein FliL